MSENFEMVAPHPKWPNIRLSNGLSMPAVGFGTYRIRDADVMMQAVDSALAAGYRMFDTASVYANEAKLRVALETLMPKYDLQREDIFLTSKLSNMEMNSKQSAIKACERSLDHLGVDFLDMYLIHFPAAGKLSHHDERNKQIRNASWAGLVDLYEKGKVLSIGVSNYTTAHIEDLRKQSHTLPVVNQVEWHPYYFDLDMLNYVRRHDIALQAYHSLGGMENGAALRADPTVVGISKEVDATPSQVLLAWALQRGIAVLPKSTSPDHIRENYTLDLKLSDNQMKALDQLKGKCHKYAWDPTNVV